MNCRTTTAPYFDDDFGHKSERAAKDEAGKTYYVPADMKYPEWKKKYIDNGNLSTLSVGKNNGTIEKPDEEHLNHLVSILDNLHVKYNEVKMYDNPLPEDEIIKTISGGDMTAGSCASRALTYIGQKGGVNVLDFRGGESQDFFSTNSHLMEIAQLPGAETIIETARSQLTAGKHLLKVQEEGKQYFFSCGGHAAIVQKMNNGYQYLELQSATRSGWHDFDGNPGYTLSRRFGCNKSGWDYRAFAISVDSLKDSKELRYLLGYINTDHDKQLKGLSGYAK